jgi:PPIC-type PPIASE domain
MRSLLIVCLLSCTSAWTQAKPASPAPSAHKRAAAQDRDDDDEKPRAASNGAAVTIKGLCAKHTTNRGAASTETACQTVITRAQFDRLLDAIGAGLSPQSKRQLATSYSRLLVRAHEAEVRGLDKTARFQETLRFARLQVLSQELNRDLKEESAKVAEKEIVEYYQKNASYFELASVERIFIPLRAKAAGDQDKSGADLTPANLHNTEDELRNKAQELRARALTEDFGKLQTEAYQAAGNQNPPLAATKQTVRRTSLPPAHLAVFDLNPNQVTPVIGDANGYYIYKLDSKQMEPLPEARPEIIKVLQQQRLQEMTDRIDQSCTTDVDASYFGPTERKSEEDED